jgi:hypothetical protein
MFYIDASVFYAYIHNEVSSSIIDAFISSFAAFIALVVDVSISVVSILFSAKSTSSINFLRCVSIFASSAVAAEAGRE